MKNVSFALVQLSCSENVANNWTKTLQAIREAAQKGAQVICLQELFQSVYFCFEEKQDFFQLAEEIPGQSTDVLSELAKELGVWCEKLANFGFREACGGPGSWCGLSDHKSRNFFDYPGFVEVLVLD